VFFFEDFIFIPDSGLSMFSFGASVCTPDFALGPPDGRENTGAAAELVEFRKIPKLQGKNTIFNEHPVV